MTSRSWSLRRIGVLVKTQASNDTYRIEAVLPGVLLRRRHLLSGATAALVLGQGAHAQPAEEFPARPIRLVVPVPPGGPADQAARVLAERLRAELGQSIVVDNKPGAAGTLGTAQVLQAPADGYTLLLSLPSAQITAPLLMDKPPYDGAKDFSAIGRFARFTGVLLVNESIPARDFASFVSYAKQRPGKLNYGSTGVGSNPHLVAELMKMRTGLRLVHIPYKGGAPALQALVADEVQVLFGEITTALPWIRTGRATALAVVSDKRSALLPDVPTLAEAGVADAPSDAWMGLAGPRGLPAAIVERLYQALAKAVRHPDMQQAFARSGAELAPSSPDELKALWAADQRRWGAVVRANHIRAE